MQNERTHILRHEYRLPDRLINPLHGQITLALAERRWVAFNLMARGVLQNVVPAAASSRTQATSM
ncbi:MAG: hypothetical protein LH481_17895 [Burkholderiales bacterium]|nr:hypothetical protein [Burkholderiales bacterium]